MAGQLIQRGERSWLVRVSIGRDAKGTRRYHNKTVRGSKRDAQQYLTKVLRDLDTGTFVEASQQPLSDFLRDWLDTSVKPRVREKTLADYEALVRRYVVLTLGHRKLQQITPQEIQRLYAAMQERGLSARTVRYTHSVVHNALEQAVKWRLLARNPAKLVNLPRQEQREMRALSKEEAGQLLAASTGTRWHALWALLLTTGLRPGEALGLKWADVDGDRLHVQRSLVRQSGKWHLAEPKTARARRVVTLPASMQRVLQAHRTEQLKERMQAGAEWSNLDLIFAARTGQPLDYRVVVRRHFKPLLTAAKLPPVRPYDLRHSCATLLLAAGENVKVVSERLGHSSAALTLDVYSHVLPDMQQAAADKLEAVLFRSQGG